MKKTQQSIDGFTPRRRPAQEKISQQKAEKSSNNDQKISARREAVKKNLQKIEKHPVSDRSIERALYNLDIDEPQAELVEDSKNQKKIEKLNRKFEKFNLRRSKKGKKTLTFAQFKRRRISRRILAVILVILLGFGVYYAARGLNSASKFLSNGSFFDFFQKEKLKTDSRGRTNVLIFGTSPKGWDGEDLADSIMVVSVDQEQKTAKTISLPRDLWVKHKCPYALGTTAGKLNESYFCGKFSQGLNIKDEKLAEKLGQDEIAKAASEVLGLDIHYKVHGNWQVLVQAIDAVGGIDVKVEVWDGSPEMYDVATKVRYKNGQVAHMNGQQALAFSRARGSAGGYGLSGGNFDRERNQQKILQATLAKINASKFDLNALIKVIDSLGDNIQHTFENKEIQTLMDLAMNFKAENVKSVPLIDETKEISLLTTGNVGAVSTVLPTAGVYDYSKIQAYIAEKTSNSKKSDSKTEEQKEDPKIIVLNGTRINGLAAQKQTELSKDGYNVVSIASAPTQNYKSNKVYISNSNNPRSAEKLAEKFSTKPEEIPAALAQYKSQADIVIVLGQ